MSSLETTGKIVKIFPTERVSEKMEKREFVLEVQEQNPQYSQQIKFELINDRCKVIDGLSEGDDVRVGFNLRGREWQGKYFVNLQAWFVKKEGASSMQTQTPTQQLQTKTNQNETQPQDDGDLPF